MPLTDAAEFSNASAAKSPPRKNTDPIQDGTFIDLAPIDDDLDEKETLASRAPS